MSVPQANPARGETTVVVDGHSRVLRPSFAALVAAEEELGPLFALVDRASQGQLRLAEITALFWHCCEGREAIAREDMGRAVMAMGLAASTTPLRELLKQILQGRSSDGETEG